MAIIELIQHFHFSAKNLIITGFSLYVINWAFPKFGLNKICRELYLIMSIIFSEKLNYLPNPIFFYDDRIRDTV